MGFWGSLELWDEISGDLTSGLDSWICYLDGPFHLYKYFLFSLLTSKLAGCIAYTCWHSSLSSHFFFISVDGYLQIPLYHFFANEIIACFIIAVVAGVYIIRFSVTN